MFRPNEAKVKNVRARDYLGKPQLVRNNTDTSHTGVTSHRRHVSADTWAKDDRPPEKVSYAATNLVRSNLLSRARQQSEPPINRNIFPPTPPPEADKPLNLRVIHPATEPIKCSPRKAATKRSPNRSDPISAPRSRSASRARPDKLKLGLAAFEQPSPPKEYARRGTARSASERPAERRPMDADSRRRPSRERLFGSVEGNESADDVGARLSQENTRGTPTSSRRRPSGRQQTHHHEHSRHQLIEEEDEGNEEVIADSPGVRGSASSAPGSHGRPSTIRTVSSRSNPVPGLRTLRVKVHFGEDTRYIIVSPNCLFGEFVEVVCKKFGAGVIGGKSGTVKIRSKDEDGDLITMGDQDDWDMAVELCRQAARREEADMGKMEVSNCFP